MQQAGNPLATAIASIGNTMFGDQLTPGLRRQEYMDKARASQNLQVLADAFGQNGPLDAAAAAKAGILAGQSPKDTALWNVFKTGNQLGPRAAETTNAMAGAGDYAASAENLDMNRANDMAKNTANNQTSRAINAASNAEKWNEFTNTPENAMVNGQPGFVRRGALGGATLPGTFADKVTGAESGGDPNARNPNSSATGAGQFLDSTWLDMMKRHEPDLAASRTPEQLLALRGDKTLATAMVDKLGDENAAVLQAKGLPVTDGTKYLAHFAGAGGATAILKADPATPIEQILPPAVIQANPFLQGKSAGDVAQWADTRMGGQGAQDGNTYAPYVKPDTASSKQSPTESFQGYLELAKLAHPEWSPDRQRNYALDQVSKKSAVAGAPKLTASQQQVAALEGGASASISHLTNGATPDNPFPAMRNLANSNYDSAMSSIGASIPFVDPGAGRTFMTREAQATFDALREIVQTHLYQVTGKSATEGETTLNMQQLLPRFSDGPDARALKEQRLISWIRALKVGASPGGAALAAPGMPSPIPSPGAAAPQALAGAPIRYDAQGNRIQ